MVNFGLVRNWQCFEQAKLRLLTRWHPFILCSKNGKMKNYHSLIKPQIIVL